MNPKNQICEKKSCQKPVWKRCSQLMQFDSWMIANHLQNNPSPFSTPVFGVVKLDESQSPGKLLKLLTKSSKNPQKILNDSSMTAKSSPGTNSHRQSSKILKSPQATTSRLLTNQNALVKFCC